MTQQHPTVVTNMKLHTQHPGVVTNMKDAHSRVRGQKKTGRTVHV